MLPDGSRITCMIYDTFSGLDLYCTDPVQHLTREGYDLDDLDDLDDLEDICLLYTSPSPRDGLLSRMPSSA